MKKILLNLKMLIKGEASLIDVSYYIQGNYRHMLYYSEYSFVRGLMRKHIREQITYRIGTMNPDCLELGYCTKCGCDTTALQMCNKTCKGLEYPPMMNRWQWKKFKDGTLVKDMENLWHFDRKTLKTTLFKENHNSYVKTPTPVK